MEYILSDKIRISRPVIFLCGPYYDKNNTGDRRNILREKIHQIYKAEKQDVLPLIVDLFLTGEFINLNEYSIQLLEEICSAVSCQTHILLDTMSAATELGIFANSAYANKINVYIPKKSDVYNLGNVGFFVREAVLKKPKSYIKYIEYRPRIVKNAYSSVFTAEHYAFNCNVLPTVIENALKEEAKQNILECDVLITFSESSSNPTLFNEICYIEKNDELSINVSIKLLFYIVSSILQQELPEIVKGNIKDISEEIIDSIIKYSIGSVVNSLAFYLGTEKKKYNKIYVCSFVENDIEDVIKHIIKFVQVYYYKSQFKYMSLITSKDYLASQTTIGEHPNVIFNLSKEQIQDIFRINKCNNAFEKIIIRSGKKNREIIKYSDSEEGLIARKLHQELNDMFRAKYKHSKYSYAYHKGSSIRKCVECHLYSKGFIKLDIKKFFSNISKLVVMKKMMNDFNIDYRFENVLDSILTCFFYEESLPLGLVMSPIISDYILYDFDCKIGEYCEENLLHYTRYADDMMISSPTMISEERKNAVVKLISSQLTEVSLNINQEKTDYINFDSSYKFIRYIGINIVMGENGNGNYLSVGKKYIYNLAKDYLTYNKLTKNTEFDNVHEKEKIEKSIFYQRAEIIGKIDFIKHVEGERGVERLQRRLHKYFPEIDLNSL